LKSCKYIETNAYSKFENPTIGIPKVYTKAFSKYKRKTSKTKKIEKKVKFSKKTSEFVYNKNLTPCIVKKDKNLFEVDNINSFKHKILSDVRVSTRRQKVSRPPEICTDFFNSFPELFNGIEDFNLNKHCVVEGCFETNRHTIQAQMNCKNFYDGGAIPSIHHYNILEVAIRDTVRKLKIKEFKGVNITDMHDFDFNLNTKPGFRYEQYLLKQSKRECVNEAVFLAEERYSHIVNASNHGKVISRKGIIPGCYCIGARNKREVDPKEGESLVSRAVHMPEFHVEIHGGIFSDLITTHLVEKQEGPVFIGNSFLKSERLAKLIENNYCAVEGDWKKFDSTLCNSMITASVSILRMYFPEGDLYDNHFLSIVDSLVIKDYQTVGGAVYRLFHGLPSGSKWTNLVGSILNLIALNYSFSDIKYSDRSFAVGGDDFVIFFKNKVKSLDKLCDSATLKATELGMEFKFLKKKNYHNSDNIDDFPVFYKYTVFKNVPVIPLESILERTLSPWNHKYKNNGEVLEFLDNLLPSLAYPTSSCFIFYYFYQYVLFRSTGNKISVNSLIISHMRIYDKMNYVGNTCSEIKQSYEKFLKGSRNIHICKIKNFVFLKKIFDF
jgi:hypothetical protein